MELHEIITQLISKRKNTFIGKFDDYLFDIAEAICVEMEKLHLNVEKLSNLTGLSNRKINKILRGNRNIKLIDYFRICQHINVNISFWVELT